MFQVLDPNADEFGPAQGTGKADQQQCAIAMPHEIVVNGLKQPSQHLHTQSPPFSCAAARRRARALRRIPARAAPTQASSVGFGQPAT